MLRPCENLRVSSSMMANAYQQEYNSLRSYSNPYRDIEATRRLLSIYNSDHSEGDNGYVSAVLAAAHSPIVRAMNFAGAGAAQDMEVVKDLVHSIRTDADRVDDSLTEESWSLDVERAAGNFLTITVAYARAWDPHDWDEDVECPIEGNTAEDAEARYQRNTAILRARYKRAKVAFEALRKL